MYKKPRRRMSKKSLESVLKLLSCVEGKVLSDLSKGWALSELKLPAYGVVLCEGKCRGCTKSGGLYLQCGRKWVKGMNFCKTCVDSFVEDGRPKNGLYEERVSVENWRSEDGKEAKTWMKYLQERGLTKEDGEEFLKSKGIESIPDGEWIVKKRGGRGRSVSDTSSEGEKGTPRFIAVDGNRKSPPKDQAHKGKNGAMLRVMYYKESGVVVKVNIQNWTDEANAKFADMYCEGEQDRNEGKEIAKKGKSKRSQKDDKMAEMTEMLAKLVAENESLKKNKTETKEEVKEVVKEDAKEAKKAALIKAKAEKKAALIKKKLEDEKKRKIEAADEAKRQQEALKAQIAALEAEEEDDFDEEDEGEIEFNEFQHNGTKYHRDEEDSLYTDDGDYWGYVNDSDEVVEGDRD